MDKAEKKALVRQWFTAFCQDSGFDATRVDESSPPSAMTLVVGKEVFPGIESQTVIPDSLLVTTSPKGLLTEYLPSIGKDLAAAWSRRLRQVRLEH
jgi:hypothetical protein